MSAKAKDRLAKVLHHILALGGSNLAPEAQRMTNEYGVVHLDAGLCEAEAIRLTRQFAALLTPAKTRHLTRMLREVQDKRNIIDCRFVPQLHALGALEDLADKPSEELVCEIKALEFRLRLALELDYAVHHGSSAHRKVRRQVLRDADAKRSM